LEEKQITFFAVVREQHGILKTGRINSRQLMPFVGQKVEVTVKLLEVKK
jgi:hypothetical protein